MAEASWLLGLARGRTPRRQPGPSADGDGDVPQPDWPLARAWPKKLADGFCGLIIMPVNRRPLFRDHPIRLFRLEQHLPPAGPA